MEILIIVLLLVLALFMLAKPELVWKAENLFLKRENRPMEGYLAVMRMMGAFFLFFALLGAFYMYIK